MHAVDILRHHTGVRRAGNHPVAVMRLTIKHSPPPLLVKIENLFRIPLECLLAGVFLNAVGSPDPSFAPVGRYAAFCGHARTGEKDDFLVLSRVCGILNIPVLYTEQYPKGLGHTVEVLQELLSEEDSLEKIAFSCCAEERSLEKLRGLNRNNVLVTGMETHVCVYQTANELIDYGYNVHLIADAVSSRTKENRDLGDSLHRKSRCMVEEYRDGDF